MEFIMEFIMEQANQRDFDIRRVYFYFLVMKLYINMAQGLLENSWLSLAKVLGVLSSSGIELINYKSTILYLAKSTLVIYRY